MNAVPKRRKREWKLTGCYFSIFYWISWNFDSFSFICLIFCLYSMVAAVNKSLSCSGKHSFFFWLVNYWLYFSSFPIFTNKEPVQDNIWDQKERNFGLYLPPERKKLSCNLLGILDRFFLFLLAAHNSLTAATLGTRRQGIPAIEALWSLRWRQERDFIARRKLEPQDRNEREEKFIPVL